ncbi:hypothetical protein L2E69_19015 [Planktothrix agardhii 1806]|jgi:hypothetical protein|uniref:hypothetical protein n=1 Tax=Planktothrix agardhii TaxID=1160 RepID=UPI001F325D37|nr:hypothetical protein [Planktothrix agardhii]MCF3605445.1 hypothetical protein [Planktothrix agardhii 1033]MCF3618016.1 hypothetical protein [Planktothrix agardhii 1806]
MNNRPLNQPHSNRDNPDPVRDESIRQNERTKVNNDIAWSTIIGIGIAVLLSLGIGFLVWPSLFKPDDSKAPTVGPGQSELNTPKTQTPGRDTVIIEKNRTQVVPVPVQVPQPKPNVNVTVPPAAPQAAPNVNVTVPPAAPQAAPNVNVTVPPAASQAEPKKDEVLPETNSSPTSEPSPPASGDTNGSGN